MKEFYKAINYLKDWLKENNSEAMVLISADGFTLSEYDDCIIGEDTGNA